MVGQAGAQRHTPAAAEPTIFSKPPSYGATELLHANHVDQSRPLLVGCGITRSSV